MAPSDPPKPQDGRRTIRLSLWADPNDPNWPGLRETQRSKLLYLLGPLLDSTNVDDITREIENAIADCKMWREAGVNAPAATRNKTRAKLAALRKAAHRMREAILDLDDESIAVLRFAPGASWTELLKDTSRAPRMELYSAHIDYDFLDHVGHVAALIGGGAAVGLAHVEKLIPVSKGGRPPYRAEYLLVRKMSDVWRRATGRGVSRQNWDDAREAEDDGPFLRFVKEVIAYTEPPKEVDATAHVRRVEQELAARGGKPFEADEELSAEELAACGLNSVENG